MSPSTKYGLCPLSVVPVRTQPSHKSEQLYQLLFGETVVVEERKGRKWLKVRFGDLSGWVLARQLLPLTPSEWERYSSQYALNLDLTGHLFREGHSLPITLGAHLPCFDGLRMVLAGQTYTFSGQAVFPEHLAPRAPLVEKLARRFLWAPEQAGGRSPFGIEAALLVQLVYKLVGVQLPRFAFQQVLLGELVNFLDEALPGDLAFFEGAGGKVNHVGILLPEGKILHVSGWARIDPLDHFGIFDAEQQRHTHRLRVIKRFLEDAPQSRPAFPEPKETPLPAQPSLFG